MNSLWLGTVYNLAIIPYRIVTETLRNLFEFKFRAVTISLAFIPISFFTYAWAGVRGRVTALPLTIDQLRRAKFVEAADAELMQLMGHTGPILDISPEK